MKYSFTLTALLFVVNLSAQFFFVLGTVNTPEIPSRNIGPTDVLMPVTFTNGTSTLLSSGTNFTLPGSNSYFISLPASPSVASAKIYVDHSVNQGFYADLLCITVADVNAIGNFIVGNSNLNGSQQIAADVDFDETVSIVDMLRIQQVILGRTNSFNNSVAVNGTTHTDVWAVYPTLSSVNQIDNSINVSYDLLYDYPNFPSNSLIGQQFSAIQLGEIDVNGCPTFFGN